MPQPQSLLFGIAALWAMVSLPLFVFQTNTGVVVFAGPGFLFHGREMLLGFLVPVIAGFLRPRLDTRWLMSLVALWLAGRFTAFSGPDIWRIAADLSLAAAFAGAVTPALARGAKKWRNRALPVLLVCLALLTGFFLASGLMRANVYRLLLPVLALALSLLLLFMGGRILVPLLRGHAKKRGMRRAPGLQPRLEGLLIAMFAACAFLLVVDWRVGAGVLAIAAGIGAMVRMVRWRPWRHGDRPELLALFAGQFWTVAALCLFGLAWASGRPIGASAVHVLTIGGVGNMTAMVMSLALLKDRPVARVWLPLIGVLLAASLVCRLAAAATSSGGGTWLTLSAIFWSATWLGVLTAASTAGLHARLFCRVSK